MQGANQATVFALELIKLLCLIDSTMKTNLRQAICLASLDYPWAVSLGEFYLGLCLACPVPLMSFDVAGDVFTDLPPDVCKGQL